jgi:aspartate-semialdehyde dehydrogenase
MKTGIIGWRGMVGSVLLNRMIAEGDFKKISPTFYSTSQAGAFGPMIEGKKHLLKSAYDLESLSEQDIILTAQGSDYTNNVYLQLRNLGWQGYWIDAASLLRMDKEALIVLDPVNLDDIKEGISKGYKTFVGGNCTVSLFLMALAPLFKAELVEWVTSMTYQAASGAGAKQMAELINQSDFLTHNITTTDPLNIAELVSAKCSDKNFPSESLGYPLAFNILPYIDSEYDNGVSKEEWKGGAELNKILNNAIPVPVDSICVRVPALRCHSQAFTLKLREEVPLKKIESFIVGGSEWVELIPNKKNDSLSKLTPLYVSGTLKIVVGRLKHSLISQDMITGFTVGDQLLWGAAEPLRRMLRILVD